MSSPSIRPVAMTGSRAHARAGRRLSHVVLGVAGWLALAGLWIWQLDVHVPADWLGGLELILATLAGWLCFSVLWVGWCRGIYRRRHRRTRPLTRTVDFGTDMLGRRVVASPGMQEMGAHVLISIPESGVKRYEIAPHRLAPATADDGEGTSPSEGSRAA
jgi:hypothetical protein